jgi:uncharacterized protein YigE (DUF2233 family)
MRFYVPWVSITAEAMKSRALVAALLLACAAHVHAAWQIASVSEESSAGAGLEHRHIALEDADTAESATLELALFSSKTATLRVVDNADGASDLARAMRANGCIAGVNGGYFDTNFAPLGLRIANGKAFARLIRARLLTGILLSTNDGVQILRVGEYGKSRRNPIAALQCGPLLVDGSRAVKGLEPTRLARRTFAVVAGDRAALGFCSDVSLAQLAQILSGVALADDFKVQRALNLDGGSSSAFWFRREKGGALSLPEEKTVRDFVGIVPK